MIGRTYLLKGEPVTVLARWRNDPPLERTWVCPGCGWIDPPLCCDCGLTGLPIPDTVCLPSGPRNVLIEYADGRRDVRPFRGLRRPREGPR